MNYSTEIRIIMRQAYHLNKEIGAYDNAKDRWRDPEYCHLLWRLKQLEHRDGELHRQAAEEFAALNGWRVAQSGTWRVQNALYKHAERTLGSNGPGIVSDLLDHLILFRLSGLRSDWIAVVGQPYEHIEPAWACELAQRLGLRCHVPPNVSASWYYPGSTQFFCFTRPEIERVHFLPEQMEVTDGASKP